MKRKALRFGMGFRVAMGNRRTQAAEMVIEPGGAEGGPANQHRGADQWLFAEQRLMVTPDPRASYHP